jgi:hypothetical protein
MKFLFSCVTPPILSVTPLEVAERFGEFGDIQLRSARDADEKLPVAVPPQLGMLTLSFFGKINRNVGIFVVSAAGATHSFLLS